MDLTNYAGMDINMLYSILNMKLRNDFKDLDELCRSLEIPREGLERHMKAKGFGYEPSLNQFRALQAP